MPPEHRDPGLDQYWGALFETAPYGVALVGPDGRFVRVNARLASMVGVPAADHVGRRPQDVVPDLGAIVDVRVQKVLATGEGLNDLHTVGRTPAAPGAR